MSLPSTVIFYKNNVEVKRSFINCGWICNQKTIKSAIKRSLLSSDAFDWDEAEAYGYRIRKEDI